MALRFGRIGAVVLIVIGGCVSLGDDLPMVASNPFNTTPQPVTETTVNHEPASEAVGKRVAIVGQKLVASNPEMNLRPRFITIGSAQPELLHLGANDLYITEGLANRCATDGQLAAVLSQELGKMVTQREILTTPATRQVHRTAPPEMPVGRDAGGAFGSPDGTRLVELARFEKDRQRDTDPLPAPNPEILARGYLEKAGYTLADLDAVAGLLREAEQNGTFYRQLQGK